MLEQYAQRGIDPLSIERDGIERLQCTHPVDGLGHSRWLEEPHGADPLHELDRLTGEADMLLSDDGWVPMAPSEDGDARDTAPARL